MRCLRTNFKKGSGFNKRGCFCVGFTHDAKVMSVRAGE